MLGLDNSLDVQLISLQLIMSCVCTTSITEKILSQIADQVESGELSDASRSEAKSIKDESAVIAVTSEGKKGTQYLPANEGDMSEQKDRQPVSQPLVSDVQQSKNIQVGNRRTRSGTKRFVAPVDEGTICIYTKSF